MSPWDFVKPKSKVLQLALGRLLEAEMGRRRGLHTVTLLAALVICTIELTSKPCWKRPKPCVVRLYAADLYCGLRLLQAEGGHWSTSFLPVWSSPRLPTSPTYYTDRCLSLPVNTLRRGWPLGLTMSAMMSSPLVLLQAAQQAAMAFRTLRSSM